MRHLFALSDLFHVCLAEAARIRLFIEQIESRLVGLVHLLDAGSAESLLNGSLPHIAGDSVVIWLVVRLRLLECVAVLLLARESRVLFLLNHRVLVAFADEAASSVLVLISKGEVRVVLVRSHVMRVILVHVDGRLPKQRCVGHGVCPVESRIVHLFLGLRVTDRELALAAGCVVHPSARLGSFRPELVRRFAHLPGHILLPARA